MRDDHHLTFAVLRHNINTLFQTILIHQLTHVEMHCNIRVASVIHKLKDIWVGTRMRTTRSAAKRRGFTLIELLIVLTILSILAGVVMLSVGGSITTARETAYTSVKGQVRTAAIAYSIQYLGYYPLTGNTTVIDGKTLGIIDVCALLLRNNPDGLFGDMPDGCISYENHGNCDSQTYDCSCDVEAHYIWAIDVNGVVYSLCVDTDLNKGGCKSTSSDGFQGVWP